ncbi:leucine-rich repeat domain-containing protein [Romboutsia maritimum]|uniref:Leucine-rich repeat domain-containing protein n=1 Tax=Romboutsia maritimum TaxID=2020948 RepID=A0A371IUQ9_9FIRM|nr:leucine-rich repeat domain-containing protein [Romboutsia maritimum]RDY24213.1 leucine-rich repeat domain-containing protein [Romboutsia maritimum]
MININKIDNGLSNDTPMFLENSNSTKYNNTPTYVLKYNNYEILFLNNMIEIYSVEYSHEDNSGLKSFFSKLKNKFKPDSNLNENIAVKTSVLKVEFNNSNQDTKIFGEDKLTDNLPTKSTISFSKILYKDIYPKIDMSLYMKDGVLECDFILNQNCNPEDINISVNKNEILSFDEDNTLKINMPNFDLKFNKPIYDKNINFNLDNNKANLNLDTYDRSVENKVYTLKQIQSKATETYFIGKKNLLIEVPKYKIFPSNINNISAFSTVLRIPYSYHEKTNSYKKSNVNIACSENPDDKQNIPIFINTIDTNLNVYIYYSIGLYNNIEDDPTNLDIYTLLDDFIVGDLDFCNTTDIDILNSKIFNPIVNVGDPILYTSSDNYYIYKLNINISLEEFDLPTPINPNVFDAIRDSLGLPPNSPITIDELNSVTHLVINPPVNPKDNALDVNFAKYLPNLVYLSITGYTVNNIDILSILPYFEELILDTCTIKVSELGSLSNITSLTLKNILTVVNPITPISSLDNLNELDIDNNKFPLSDLSIVGTLTNLSFLDVSHNAIKDIIPLANLINLKALDISHNQISDISPLEILENLATLFANNQAIYHIPIYVDIDDMAILDISFLKNLAGDTPSIDAISNDGVVCDETLSCDPPSIVWENVEFTIENATVEFSGIGINPFTVDSIFNGTIFVNIQKNITE